MRFLISSLSLSCAEVDSVSKPRRFWQPQSSQPLTAYWPQGAGTPAGLLVLLDQASLLPKGVEEASCHKVNGM